MKNLSCGFVNCSFPDVKSCFSCPALSIKNVVHFSNLKPDGKLKKQSPAKDFEQLPLFGGAA
jgi:hypothetical protein